MINIKRKEGKKVDFLDVTLRKPMLDRKEKEILRKEDEIKDKFEKIKSVEMIISQIQSEIQVKSSDLVKKEQEILKMAGIWADMNSINLKSLSEEEVRKIVNSQKGFIRDLLEHYINSTKKEKEYLTEIEQLRKANKRLLEEVDSVMKEIEDLQ